MIDLVYPIKQNGSRLGDQELRYSLRSIEQNLKLDVGKLAIFGHRPDWLIGDVFHVKMEDRGDKAMNLRDKYVRMCKTAEVSDPFLLLDDDHMFLQQTTMVPLVTKGTLYELVRQYTGTMHGKYLKSCLDELMKAGLPSRNYQIHYPMLIHKDVLLNCTTMMKRPMVMGSLYGNSIGGGSEVPRDYRVNTEADFAAVRDGPFMSLPPIANKTVLAFLGQMFATPSRWEAAPLEATG